MSIALLELGASALGDLTHEVVFTGGATVGLWITDPAAPEPRPTEDIDVIVEVTTRGSLADFEQRLRERRFREDQDSGIVCRWRHADSDLVLDAMPTNGSILGFENRWQGPAVPYAIQRELPSGAGIAAASPPFLLATKLEAFASRGRDDYIASRDMAGIISLFDGRAELVAPIPRRRTVASPSTPALHRRRLRRLAARRREPGTRCRDRASASGDDHSCELTLNASVRQAPPGVSSGEWQSAEHNRRSPSGGSAG